MTTVSVSIYMDVTDYDLIKRMERHIEEFLDLDSYPEIKSVYGVKVSLVENNFDNYNYPRKR